MISELLELLKSNEKIYAWNVLQATINSYQLFCIKQNLDMNREVQFEEYNVTIFKKDEIRGKEVLGSSSFIVYSSMTVEEIKEKIEEQLSYCEFTYRKMYVLPKKNSVKPVSKEVSFSGYSLKDAAFVAADALFEADKFDKGYINSSEIYINFIETRFYDSNGNSFLFTREKGEIEMVATWKEKKEEVEVYRKFEFDNLNSLFIQNEANKALIEASNKIKAIKMPAINGYKILLTQDYVKKYFLHFAYKATTDAIFDKKSTYHLGHDVQKHSMGSDKISIKADPLLKNSTRGMPFDNEGIVLKRLNIIEKGIVKNLWGCNAKSQHVNKIANGTYSNFIVSAGTLTKEELENENYLEIISLSDFDIDNLTGDFAGEIRLACLHQKGKESTFVTGGSISGNIYDSLDRVRFTKETAQNNNFIGPVGVMLDKISFNGGE